MLRAGAKTLTVTLITCLGLAALSVPAVADSDWRVAPSAGPTDRPHSHVSEHENSDERESEHSWPTPSVPPVTQPTPDPTTSSTPAPTPSTLPVPSPTPSAPAPAPRPSPSDSPTVPAPIAPSPSADSSLKPESNTNNGNTPWLPLGAIPVRVVPTTGRAAVNGVSVASVLRANGDRTGLQLLVGNWQIGVGALDAAGRDIGLGADGTLRVERSHSFEFTGSGFAPNSSVHIYVFSNPILIGMLQTDDGGDFYATLPVPDELPNGLHTLQVMGYSVKGEIQMGEIPVSLVSNGAKPTATASASVTPAPTDSTVLKPTLFQRTGVIYFTPGTAASLKRSQVTLRKVIAELSGAKNLHVAITAVNSRKDRNPSRALAVARLRQVAVGIAKRVPVTTLTRGIGPVRRNHWGYVRYLISFRR